MFQDKPLQYYEFYVVDPLPPAVKICDEGQFPVPKETMHAYRVSFIGPAGVEYDGEQIYKIYLEQQGKIQCKTCNQIESLALSHKGKCQFCYEQKLGYAKYL